MLDAIESYQLLRPFQPVVERTKSQKLLRPRAGQ